MTSKSVYYLIAYEHRDFRFSHNEGSGLSRENQVLKDEHPMDWLIDMRENHRGSGSNQHEYKLLFWDEISEAQYDKWVEAFG